MLGNDFQPFLSKKKISGYLFSRAVSHQVFSAFKGLTSVFGMGTGGPLWQSPLIMVKGVLYTLKIEHIFTKVFWIVFGQALGLLVSVSLIHYCTYTSDLSIT